MTDFQQAIDTLEALRRDVTIHPTTDAAYGTAILALRALRDAPVVRFWMGNRDGEFCVNTPEEAASVPHARVRLVVVGENKT